MSIREKIINRLSGGAIEKRVKQATAEIAARYDAAIWSNARTYLPAFIQNASSDINTLSRSEILRRTRYFEKNSGVFGKVLRVLDVNVVGSGIVPTPTSSNAVWRGKALAWWSEWIEQADKTEQSSYYKLQSIAYRAENVDGDAFEHLTLNAAGRPAIDLIEGHRVGTVGVNVKAYESMGFRVIDGVVIDKNSRPVAYLVADEFDGTVVNSIPASQIVKHFSRKRAGQYRGISIMHAAIIDLHDSDDLQKYEMRAAKDAASISKTIETAAGAVSADGSAIGASLSNANTTDATARAQYYKQALGAETIVTNPGDKILQFESKRPSAAMSGFWEKLDKKVVQGAGISYAALVDYEGNWGGATLRACAQSDSRTYELETVEQARAAQRVWEYAIGWAIKMGELPPDAEWNKVRWHPPVRATVDVGNDSNAMIQELKGGMRTYESIYGERGDDWRDRLEQRAKEEQFIDELAEKYGVPREFIASFAQERMVLAPDGKAGAPAGSAQPTGGEGQ
jgi:lambda family phage portal protein